MSDQSLIFEGSFVEIKRIETELKYMNREHNRMIRPMDDGL